MLKYIEGSKQYIDECTEALQESELGRVYFSAKDKARQAIYEGISNNELIIATDDDNDFLGFLWYIPKGAFHSFPYLHIIAVRKQYRNQGIGKMLLKYFEDTICKNSKKVFLVVADFNPEAKRLYEKVGYCEVGRIPNLYKTGICESLMMKEL